MKSLSDIKKLMRWAKHRQLGISPLLNFKGRLMFDSAERVTILRDNLLARHEESDDPASFTIPSKFRIPWDEEFSAMQI